MQIRGNTQIIQNTITQDRLSLAAPVNPSDAVRLQDVQGLLNGRDFKDSVRVASTANVTLTAPGAAIDGITLGNGDRLLLKDQTDQTANGIYVFNGASSALTRASDANSAGSVSPGLTVFVEDGNTNRGGEWTLLEPTGFTGAVTLGTTNLPFIKTNAQPTVPTPIRRETPSGTVNGTNSVFNLANTPTLGTEEVYLNGVQQDAGASNDYVISGATITFNTAPVSGDKVRVSYFK